jgi:hypothetical protein
MRIVTRTYVSGRYLIMRRGAGCGLSGAGGMFAVDCWSHGQGRPGFEVI